MKNLSLVSEITIAVTFYTVLLILTTGAMLFGVSPVYTSVIGAVLLMAFTVVVTRRVHRYSGQIAKISTLATEVSGGRFEYRITHIPPKTELGDVSWKLNDMLDQLEAMFREIKTTVDYNSQGKYFRKPQQVGLHAGFGSVLDIVEKSLARTETTDRSLKEDHTYLTTKIAEMLEQMSLFAAGDMTIAMKTDRDDEIGELYKGFNRAIVNIRNMMQRVAEAVSATASASAEISASAEEMAAGASRQTEQASEVAAAVEEMSQTIVESTRNAKKASDLANQSGETARIGGAVVTKTIAGMNRIAEVVRLSAETVQELGKSSDQIGEIIQVIDDIADQTNLLALNAAIEAARAGEQGRGFAVVADEVRKLAERTTKATKEIANMIKQIQKNTEGAVVSMVEGTKEVDAGKELADNAGSSLHEIIASSGSVVDTVMQLAATSEEQAKASDQISRSITSISDVTQETASGTRQIAQAAQDLNQLTENLQDLVGHFKISDNVKKISGQHEADATEILLVLESAMTAHKMWRMRVQRLMSRSEEIDSKNVTSHHECKFGRWYYSDGKAMFKENLVFEHLGKAHKEMHLLLKDLVGHWNGGNEELAREQAKGVYKLSDEVVRLIEELKSDVRKR